MELKVRQLEKARGPPEAKSPIRRSLPSTPSEDINTWSKFNMTKELDEARKQIKIKDQQILQLRAQVPDLRSPAPFVGPGTPSPSPLSTPSPDIEAKLFKSSLQIAERSKTSSISFQDSNKVIFWAYLDVGDQIGVRMFYQF